jgi:uncharacterized metal-binding protein YceD (DUF177 family)
MTRGGERQTLGCDTHGKSELHMKHTRNYVTRFFRHKTKANNDARCRLDVEIHYQLTYACNRCMRSATINNFEPMPK